MIKNHHSDFSTENDYRTAIACVNATPSAEPDRKKGKWIKKMCVTETDSYTSYDPEWYCATCGTKYDPHIAQMINYCYTCRADMRGKQDE